MKTKIKELTKIVENLGWVPDKKWNAEWERGNRRLSIWIWDTTKFNEINDNDKKPCYEYNLMVHDKDLMDKKDGYIQKENTLDYDEFKKMITKYGK